ncbi:hypothetical protein [Streptomyces sp. HM190]|uniref:hypothetical protein n=1 Tax=Streptomyces sp. HM190 TaxID=2695266 RepID=UPI001359D5D0|nr:hypothetical protein [Streptomyces sp. HM190]
MSPTARPAPTRAPHPAAPGTPGEPPAGHGGASVPGAASAVAARGAARSAGPGAEARAPSGGPRGARPAGARSVPPGTAVSLPAGPRPDAPGSPGDTPAGVRAASAGPRGVPSAGARAASGAAAVPGAASGVAARGAVRPGGPERPARGAGLWARRIAWRAVRSLRPGALGVCAFAQAALVAWVAYRRTRPPAPQPGDHAWWHGGGPQAAGHTAHGDASGPVLYLALATAALYLLLPLFALAAHTVRHLGGGAWTFAAVSGAVGAAVAVPVTALAIALTPGAPAASWAAAGGHALTALRICAPAGLLLAVAVGVPSRARHRADRPPRPVEKRTRSC